MASQPGNIGNIANSLYQAFNLPDLPSLREIYFKGAKGLYGGYAFGKNKQMAKLEARIGTEDERPGDAARLEQLKKQEEKSPGLLDQVLKAQQEFLPEFDKAMLERIATLSPQLSQLKLDEYRQFAPAFAQAGYETQRGLTPEFFDLQTATAQRAREQLGQGLTPQQLEFARQQARIAQEARGLSESPLGSAQEMHYLTQLNTAMEQQHFQNAIAAAQAFRVPASYPLPQFGVESAASLMGFPQVAQAFSPPSLGESIGMQSGLSQAQIAQQQYKNALIGGAIQSGVELVGSAAMGGFGAMGGMGGLGLGGTSMPFMDWQQLTGSGIGANPFGT